MKILTLVFLGLLAGCSFSSRPQLPLAVHDLGPSFEVLPIPSFPVSQFSVSGNSLSSGLGMQYRQASLPTVRSSYAFNRWAVAPADLLQTALNRALPLTASAPCRMSFQISDFILEIKSPDKAEAYLAGSLHLSADGRREIATRRVDIRVSVEKIEPAGFALGERKAVIALAREAADWVLGDLSQICKKP